MADTASPMERWNSVRGWKVALAGATVMLAIFFIGTKLLAFAVGDSVSFDWRGTAVFFLASIPLFALVLRVVVAQDITPANRAWAVGIATVVGLTPFGAPGFGWQNVVHAVFGGVLASFTVSAVAARLREP